MSEQKYMLPFEAAPQNLSTMAVARVAADPEALELAQRRDKILAQVERVPTGEELEAQDLTGKAVDLVKLVKLCNTAQDELRKAYVTEPDRAVKAVNKWFREQFTDPLTRAEKGLKAKVGTAQGIAQRKADEAARKAREEAEAQALALAEKAREVAGDEAAEAIIEQGIKTAEAETKAANKGPARGGTASASVRKVWKWKITDASQVPREFLTVDSVLVNEAVRRGEREIPGIEIYQENEVAIR